MKIGVIIESFRLPLEQSLDLAAEYGIDGVFLSRFVSETTSISRARHVNTVLANVREGCHREGRDDRGQRQRDGSEWGTHENHSVMLQMLARVFARAR